MKPEEEKKSSEAEGEKVATDKEKEEPAVEVKDLVDLKDKLSSE